MQKRKGKEFLLLKSSSKMSNVADPNNKKTLKIIFFLLTRRKVDAGTEKI